MATINQTISSLTPDSTTTREVVGLCYFDAQTETLKEFNSMGDMFFTIHPKTYSLKKFYLVIDPSESLDYVMVQIDPEDSSYKGYTVKVLMNEGEPSISTFDVLPSFNSFRINNPTSGEFLSVWILVSSNADHNQLMNADISVTYE